MAAMRATINTIMLARSIIIRPTLLHRVSFPNTWPFSGFRGVCLRAPPGFCAVRCASAKSDEKKSPARLAEVQRMLCEAEERYKAAGGGVDPIPQITLDHVSVTYARSGGPGGQNVNKVNTKVDMRFNVKNAHWLSEWVRERIMQMSRLEASCEQITAARLSPLTTMSTSDHVSLGEVREQAISMDSKDVLSRKEKNRINKDGEIVISSTKTRTQKGNTEDALAKLQAIIDAASYVPPPPSEETVKKIARLSAVGEQKRLDKKKAQSQKKAQRRSRDSWD